MKVTRVHIEYAGVVVCLATSGSAAHAWDDVHRMLRGRGARTRKAAIDLLFVVADSRDPRWYRETAALCRKAQLAVVQGAAYPELGAEQFALGISTYYTWMARFFDVVVTTEEQPGAVLRALLDFLAEGLVCSDFADLKAMLHHAGTCALHRRAFATNDQVESARNMIERDRNLARALGMRIASCVLSERIGSAQTRSASWNRLTEIHPFPHSTSCGRQMPIIRTSCSFALRSRGTDRIAAIVRSRLPKTWPRLMRTATVVSGRVD